MDYIRGVYNIFANKKYNGFQKTIIESYIDDVGLI